MGTTSLVDLELVLVDEFFRQVEGIRQQKPESVNGGIALGGLIVQLVSADLTTDFPTTLTQRFLDTTSLVDLGSALVDEFSDQSRVSKRILSTASLVDLEFALVVEFSDRRGYLAA